MKHFSTLIMAVLFIFSGQVFSQSEAKRQEEAARAKKVDTRVDNNGYWRRLAEQGLAKLNGVQPVPPAIFKGSGIRAFSVITEDSPDVPVAPENTTQSENSTFVSPEDDQLVINSNNSSQNPLGSFYGANAVESEDGGQSWGGTVQGAGGYNSGDPVALIGLDGTYYIGFISASGGQAIGKSTNGGSSYTVYNVANAPGGGLLDKNHMWIDNSPVSTFKGNLYDAWTDFGGAFDSDIALSRSTNGGSSWSTAVNVSSAVNAGSHCQGVNINSGPNGEVYVIWAIYDSWPSDETAIGMARSFDGGATWNPGTRAIQNIRGIRNTGVGKNMRNNAFPSMAVDISGKTYNGNIYIVWANVGIPGVNSGTDVDVYVARSEDQGATWATPVRVNQDPSGMGHKHYFPWVTCDPETGIVSVVFYDDRNVGGLQCEVYCANSYDGGATWEDFKVSDVAFTPTPIPGLADGYMGDYIGINARGGWVYPTWADTRTGSVMTYVSAYQTNPLARPKNLTGEVEFETGLTSLNWSFEGSPGFSYFMIYRDGDMIGTSTDTTYTDQLPDYGIYTYKVSAFYEGVGESNSSNTSVQWGDAQISVTPLEIAETLQRDSSVTRYITINNVGQLDMNFNLTLFVPTEQPDQSRDYCTAAGSCDEYISRVQLNEIDNPSSCTQYGDYTGISTVMAVGNTYQITVTNGNPIYSDDKCGLWVDWNQNQVFDDNESIAMNGSPGVGPYTALIVPPTGSKTGVTRLRTRIVYYGQPTPCGTTTYGEVEDYTVFVQSWLNVDPPFGNVTPGGTIQIEVTLSAADLDLGTYTAELQVYSNDPDDPMITVPITLDVVDLAVLISADQDTICNGESVQLSSNIIGGSGNITYDWTSIPEGFASQEPNPVVTPNETTTYILQVSDELLLAQDEITIQVNPVPVVDLGADMTICDGDSVTYDAGEGYASYLWSTGDTTSTITAFDKGDYWVQVATEFGCAATDTVMLTVNTIPEKPVVSSGPSTVDNFITSSSTYTCDEISNALGYTWSVIPEGAGTISGTGTSAVIDWTAEYTGSVQVSVTAANDCGDSETSDLYYTEVYSSQGIPENSFTGLMVYPNPGHGLFNLKMASTADTRADLKVTDATGAVVFQKPGVVLPAKGLVELDLSNLADGIYTLQVISKGTVYLEKLIIKR